MRTTTLLNIFGNTWSIKYEPIETWQTYRGINWLDLMYKDPQTHLINFQIVVLASFMERILQLPNERALVERSP